MLRIRIRILLLLTSVLCFGNVVGHSMDENYGRWDGGLPLKPTRTVEFQTDEGTDISLDVSPDGRTIVFELLGDLYTLLIDGGEAKRITSGIAIDSAPRFSPDGKTIAFASDRSGMANVWIVNPDGAGSRQISKFDNLLDPDSPRDLQSIVWAPDGQSVIAFAKGHFVEKTTNHFLRVRIDNGAVTDLTPGITEAINAGGIAERDGSAVWYGGGPTATKRLHRTDVGTGATEIFKIPVSNSTRAESPAISPDGRWLVYRVSLRSLGESSELRLHDFLGPKDFDKDVILTSEESAPELSHIYNMYDPQYAFTPDSKSIVYASFGKIKRLDIETKQVTIIPFRAKVRAELGPLVGNPSWELTGPIKVKQLRSVNSTADGKTIVFSALGKIWVKRNDEKPQRLTSTDRREYDPVLSPDEKWVAYATWSFVDGGQLWKMPATGGESLQLAVTKGQAFTTPRWTPDGSQVVAIRAEMTKQRSSEGALSPKLTVVRVPAEGGQTYEITPIREWSGIYAFQLPTLSITGGRVFFFEGGGSSDPEKYLCSVDIGGVGKRQDIKFEGHWGISPAMSPDGKWLAFQYEYNIFVVPISEPGATGKVPVVTLRGHKAASRVRKLTTDGGVEPRWSEDGKWLSWSWANKLHRLPYDEATSRRGPIKPQVTTIDLNVVRHQPKGHLLLTNARVITMADAGSPNADKYKGTPMGTDPRVIERGDVLLEGANIKAVGPSGTLKAPAGTKTVDLAGKSIVPGYFALHEHEVATGALIQEQSPIRIAYLAAGFTTIQHPGPHYSAWYAEEMVDAGELVGPRTVGGLVMTYEERIPDYAAAEAIVRKSKSAGAYLIKVYEQSHRVQRQWISMAAAKYGLRVICHPVKSNVADGCTEVAHSLAGTPHRDVEELARRSRTTVEITHLQSRIDLEKKYSSYAIIEAEKNLFPPGHLSSVGTVRARTGEIAPVSDKPRDLTLRQRLELIRQGDSIRSGWSRASGTDRFIGFVINHFQVWELVHPEGLTNAEALRVLTIDGARALGFEKDLGSIEPGKIADLVILNSNPLDDIKSTLNIKYLVKGGEVYDLNDEFAALWPVRRNLVRFPWMPKRSESTAGKETPAKSNLLRTNEPGVSQIKFLFAQYSPCPLW